MKDPTYPPPVGPNATAQPLATAQLESVWTSVLLCEVLSSSTLTTAVVVGQIAFLVTLYAPALWASQVSAKHFHISALLDDDVRSRACAVVGLMTLLPMVLLELQRDLPLPATRIGLAAATGLGILLTCVVRESHYVNGHRLCAVLAFAAATLLVMLLAYLAESDHEAGMLLACGLVVTGLGQSLNIVADNLKLSFRPLPSWALGSLEIVLVAGFGACMGVHASAGALVPRDGGCTPASGVVDTPPNRSSSIGRGAVVSWMRILDDDVYATAIAAVVSRDA